MNIYNVMKFITLILFSLLISCQLTPEKKIEKSFYDQRRYVIHPNINVKDVKIYDTVYMTSVITNMMRIEYSIKNLQDSIKKIDNLSDSIIKSNLPKKDSLLHQEFLKASKYRRKLDHEFYTEGVNNSLFDLESKDTIAGYYVRIITNRDTLELVVKPDFKILCPVFMYGIGP
jgi:hypothetical protein